MSKFKDFMRDELKGDLTVELTGVPTFTGENGQPRPLTIKLLSMDDMDKIRKMHTIRKPLRDGAGKPVRIRGQGIQMDDVTDNSAAMHHMFAESFIDPDMHEMVKDEDFKAFYKDATGKMLVDVVDVSRFLFRNPKDFSTLTDQWLEAHGLNSDSAFEDGNAQDDAIDEAKN